MIYKVIIFVVLCIVQQALAITYTFDLSGGDASQMTRCCGGPDYKKGSWKFENATSFLYGYKNGTIYTTNGSSCIRPKQSLKFTNNSVLTVWLYVDAFDGNHKYEVYIVNKERNQKFLWLQSIFVHGSIGASYKTLYLNQHVNSTQQPWIFNNENYLELIFAKWYGLREIIFENVDD